jgi:hypothetical protein
MLGILGWPPTQLACLNYRQLLVAYQAKVIHDWDQTVLLASQLSLLQCTVISLVGKAPPMLTYEELHPYPSRKLKPTKKQADITPQNIGVLRRMWKAR